MNRSDSEAQKFGYKTADEAISKNWDKLPEWLQTDLLNSGFKNEMIDDGDKLKRKI